MTLREVASRRPEGMAIGAGCAVEDLRDASDVGGVGMKVDVDVQFDAFDAWGVPKAKLEIDARELPKANPQFFNMFG